MVPRLHGRVDGPAVARQGRWSDVARPFEPRFTGLAAQRCRPVVHGGLAGMTIVSRRAPFTGLLAVRLQPSPPPAQSALAAPPPAPAHAEPAGCARNS